MDGISISSKNKKARGKRYYAEDSLAFTAWDLLGFDPDDKEFQRWKYYKQKQHKKE